MAAFEGVCQAVGYAHAHGVIHRDLKPANVMVGNFGEVQVMDWGLAKVLADRRPDPADPDATAPLTEFASARDADDATKAGSLLGTPAYMPPEQALGAVDEVDQRSNVFGLGAVLCAILTGRPPFSGGSAEDTRRKAARGQTGDALARLDAGGADPGLAALCKQCLAVDKAARPADAGAVAAAVAALRAAADDRARQAELDRVRADGERARAEAEAAGQARRRRLVQRWAAGVGVALVLGIGGTAAGLVQANLARGEAETKRGEAEEARQAEATQAEAARAKQAEAETARREEARQRAVAQAERAEAEKARQKEADERGRADERAAAATAAREFLKSVLTQANPWLATRERAADPGRTLRQALDFAAEEIGGKFDRQPEIAADLRNTIGLAYIGLAAWAAAEPHLTAALELREKALGPDHPDTLESANNLAGLYSITLRLRAAEPLYRRALDGWEKVYGPDHPDTLIVVFNLGKLYARVRDPGRAEPLLRRALVGREKALGSGDPETLGAAHALGLLYLEAGDFRAARPLLERALEGTESALGPDHHETFRAAHNLAGLYQEMGDLRRAEPLLARALAGNQKVHGPDHPDTLSSAANLAVIHWRMGRLDRAVPLFEDTLRRRRAALGDDHPDTLHTMANLGVNYRGVGRPAEAVPLLERAYAARAEHPFLAQFGDALAAAYAAAGRHADAVRVARAGLAEGRAKVPPGSPELGGLLAVTGKVLLDLDPAAAEPVLRECLAVRQKLAPEAWTTANAKSLLGGALLLQGKPAEAEPLLAAGYAGLLADRRNIPPLPQAQANLPEAADRLARVYLALGQPEEAARWREERKKYPPDTAPRPRAVVHLAPPPREAGR